MSLNNFNFTPKCYKIIYNQLSANGIDNFKDIISEMTISKDSIKLVEELNQLSLDNATDFRYDNYNSNSIDNHFKYPKVGNKLIFIFVGDITPAVYDILKTITNKTNFNNISDPLHEDVLNKYFRYNIREEWKIINDVNPKKIFFIPHLIHEFDNISVITNIISNIISKYTVDTNDIALSTILKPEHIYMYSDSSINLEKKYFNFKTDILSKYKSKLLNFNIFSLKSTFENIGIPDKIIDEIISKYNHNIEDNIYNILEEPIVIHYFEMNEKYKSLTNTIRYRSKKKFISSNIYPWC